MTPTLFDLPVGARPRLLFLCTDPALARGQLQGRELTQAEAGPLRDDVSTDEITPVHIRDPAADRPERL